MSAPPRVTVIIPTWNWSTVLPFSIGSVLGQTFDDFELLVIGDGCSDDSAEVVRATGDSRVRWINLAHGVGHQSGPNNEGLRQARGSLIAYLGHDDLWLPHHLEVHLEAFGRGADLTHSLVAAVRPDGSVRPLVPAAGGWNPPTGMMHRREVAERAGGWKHYRDLPITPEVELCERFVAAGFRQAIVQRLTAIKFPASERRDVYRIRSAHEQAAWLARVRAEPDLESMLLAGIVFELARAPGALARLVRLLRQPWRWRAVIGRRLFGRRGLDIAAIKRFKGVD